MCETTFIIDNRNVVRPCRRQRIDLVDLRIYHDFVGRFRPRVLNCVASLFLLENWEGYACFVAQCSVGSLAEHSRSFVPWTILRFDFSIEIA